MRIRHLHLDGHVNSQDYRYWAQHRAWRKQRGRYTWAKAGAQTGGWCTIDAPGSCGPIWADGDDGQTVMVNAKRSLGDFGVACAGAAATRRTGCTPSGSSRVARCPTVQQIPNPAAGPLPGACDCQGSGHWIVFLLAGFDPTGLFPVTLSDVTSLQRWVQNSCISQESRGKGDTTGSCRHVPRRGRKCL